MEWDERGAFKFLLLPDTLWGFEAGAPALLQFGGQQGEEEEYDGMTLRMPYGEYETSRWLPHCVVTSDNTGWPLMGLPERFRNLPYADPSGVTRYFAEPANKKELAGPGREMLQGWKAARGRGRIYVPAAVEYPLVRPPANDDEVMNRHRAVFKKMVTGTRSSGVPDDIERWMPEEVVMLPVGEWSGVGMQKQAKKAPKTAKKGKGGEGEKDARELLIDETDDVVIAIRNTFMKSLGRDTVRWSDNIRIFGLSTLRAGWDWLVIPDPAEDLGDAKRAELVEESISEILPTVYSTETGEIIVEPYLRPRVQGQKKTPAQALVERSKWAKKSSAFKKAWKALFSGAVANVWRGGRYYSMSKEDADKGAKAWEELCQKHGDVLLK